MYEELNMKRIRITFQSFRIQYLTLERKYFSISRTER